MPNSREADITKCVLGKVLYYDRQRHLLGSRSDVASGYQSTVSTCYSTTHTRLTALCLGLCRWDGTRKVKPIWILLKQETVSGSGISWAICKSAHRSRLITTPAHHHSVFYRPDALPAAQPTASKHCYSTTSQQKHWEQSNWLTPSDTIAFNVCSSFLVSR